MAKRYHQSKKSRSDESRGMKRVMHRKDTFNDQHSNSREPEMTGPYHYDREKSEMRSKEHSMHRLRSMMSKEYYAGPDPRRRMEMEDAGMIHEDNRALANLPQQVIMKPYPMAGGYLPEDLDDTLIGVDRQLNYDGRKRMEHFFPKKV